MPAKKNATSAAAVSWSVRTVHGVGVDAVGEVGADGAGGSLLGIGGTHQVAVLGNGAFAFQRLDHHRAGDHEVHQVLEERTLFVHSVEGFGFAARQVGHAGGHDLQAGRFKTGVDLADHVLGDSVGFDDREGAFDGHGGP